MFSVFFYLKEGVRQLITITRDSWARIPFEKVAPYDVNDIMICLSDKVSIVLNNICDFQRKRFSIASVMTSDAHKETFFTSEELSKMKDAEGKKQVFNDRLTAFAKDMDTIMERYFLTDKMPRYLYFDKKEQDTLRKILTSVPWTCNVMVIRKFKDGSRKAINIEALKEKGVSNLQKMLSPVKLQVELGLNEYLKLHGKKVRSMANEFKSREELLLNRIFKEYPELNVETLSEFKKIVRAKSKELHPDTSTEDDAADKFAAFNDAVKALKDTAWYKKLENKKE